MKGINLLKNLLKIPYNSRFSAEEALTHSWFCSSAKSKRELFLGSDFFHFHSKNPPSNKISELQICLKEKAVSLINKEEKNQDFINQNKRKSFKENKKYSTLGVLKEKNAEETDGKGLQNYPNMETIESLSSMIVEDIKEGKRLKNSYGSKKRELFKKKSSSFILKNL